MSFDSKIEDLVTPELTKVAMGLRHPSSLLKRIGKRVEQELQQYFIRRDSEGNQKGWWRSHFWNREIAHNTKFQGATDTEATVSISNAKFLQKLYGGTITAKTGKMLAIPLTSEAKKKGPPRNWTARFLAPGNWNSSNALFVLKTPHNAFLARKVGTGKSATIERLYLLVSSVTQQPDPRALPPKMFMDSIVEDETDKFLKRSLA